MSDIRETFLIDPAEYDDISHDPWEWRWTDNEVRSSLRRLIPTTARAIWEVLWDYADRRTYQLSREYFNSVEPRPTDADEEAVAAWFLQHDSNVQQDIFVAYELHDHVYMVSWDTFCRCWADFCFPSDEIIISPLTEEWVLYFHHEEIFFWGQPTHKATGRRLPRWRLAE